MASITWIKVIGFSDVERHALNTLIRLSARQAPAFALWTPESPTPPHVALMDVDSYEARLELASPGFNPHLKCICVGARSFKTVWPTLERPLDWYALVRELDALFVLQPGVDIDLGTDGLADKSVPPGVTVTLIVGMSREERLYLRSRLAIAGMTVVDEADSADEANARCAQRPYALVIVSLELQDADPWSFVAALRSVPDMPRSVIMTTHAPSWAAMEMAERAGCAGLLEIPFSPRQVLELLQKV
jgi:CheY-like chemotaxis protein